LSIVAVAVTLLVADRTFERIPHLEDEVAFVWQAEVIARGNLTLPSPPNPNSFLVPFVIDHEGQRFAKYPPGWPALLAIGIVTVGRDLMNPLLAGLAIWLTYRLGRKLWSAPVGLLAAGLTLTSPFYLMNSATLLSHPFGLVLSAAFALAWLDWEPGASPKKKWLTTLVAGLSLGILAVTRPWTAVGVALPFVLHAAYRMIRGGWQVRKHLLLVAVVAGSTASLFIVWQYAVTGDPFLNPYTLWWPYDKVGFGPGHGTAEQGHTLRHAFVNTRMNLLWGAHDLYGWGKYSWIFLPFGFLALIQKKNWPALLISSVFVGLVIAYGFYWVGFWGFGPRYYYEGLYSLTILSAAGIAFLAGVPVKHYRAWMKFTGWQRLRPLAVLALLIFLISSNLVYYTPNRLQGLFGLYDMQRETLHPFEIAEGQKLTPALVIVHASIWTEYGVFLELANPYLDSPFIFVLSRTPQENTELAQHFPERRVYHYYPDEPYVLYPQPRPAVGIDLYQFE
jgi:4-amino-4-deoxy-L-arabinose transferase-like glycosyltransferase